MTQIPTRSREIVSGRELGQCFRCGSPCRVGHWHHRRSRSVSGEHQHCPCNGIWLCSTCHEWVHAHPFEARAHGWIVARNVKEPGSITAQSHFGPLLLACSGGYRYDPTGEMDE